MSKNWGTAGVGTFTRDLKREQMEVETRMKEAFDCFAEEVTLYADSVPVEREVRFAKPLVLDEMKYAKVAPVFVIWKCRYCGTPQIGDLMAKCTNCGAPRWNGGGV